MGGGEGGGTEVGARTSRVKARKEALRWGTRGITSGKGQTPTPSTPRHQHPRPNQSTNRSDAQKKDKQTEERGQRTLSSVDKVHAPFQHRIVELLKRLGLVVLNAKGHGAEANLRDLQVGRAELHFGQPHGRPGGGGERRTSVSAAAGPGRRPRHGSAGAGPARGPRQSATRGDAKGGGGVEEARRRRARKGRARDHGPQWPPAPRWSSVGCGPEGRSRNEGAPQWQRPPAVCEPGHQSGMDQSLSIHHYGDQIGITDMVNRLNTENLSIGIEETAWSIFQKARAASVALWRGGVRLTLGAVAAWLPSRAPAAPHCCSGRFFCRRRSCRCCFLSLWCS